MTIFNHSSRIFGNSYKTQNCYLFNDNNGSLTQDVILTTRANFNSFHSSRVYVSTAPLPSKLHCLLLICMVILFQGGIYPYVGLQASGSAEIDFIVIGGGMKLTGTFMHTQFPIYLKLKYQTMPVRLRYDCMRIIFSELL